MLPSFIGEHKQDAGIFAAGAGAGALIGREVYKHTPTGMTRIVIEEGKKKEYITNRFINYARDVSKKDIFSTIDPHTERSWVKHKLETINKTASRAKTNPKGGERWQFQKIYNLGIKFMTDRKEVAKEDLGLAKRGANAIYHGRATEKRNTIAICAAALGILCLAAKKGIEKYKELKSEKQM